MNIKSKYLDKEWYRYYLWNVIFYQVKYFIRARVWILYRRAFTIEFALDLRQWAIGGNYYPYQLTWDASTINIFLFCFRLGLFRTGQQKAKYPKLFG